MKKSRIITIFFLVLCTIFAPHFVVGADMQEYLSLVYCNYSLNDENFGEWDSINGKGVFYSFRNERADTRNIEPRYFYYDGTNTASRRYFNTGYYGTSSENSKIPILDIGPAKENMVYARCKIKSLTNVQTPITFYTPFSGTGRFRTIVTGDFNLTNFTFSSPSNLYTLDSNSGAFASSKLHIPNAGAISASKLIDYPYNLIRYTDSSGNHLENWPNERLRNSYFIGPGEEVDFFSSYNFSEVKSSNLLFAGVAVLGNGDSPYISSITSPNNNRIKATLVTYLRSTFMSADEQYQYVLNNLIDPEIKFKSINLQGGGPLIGDNINNTFYHFFTPGEIIEGEILINNSLYDHNFSSERVLDLFFEKIPSYGIGHRYSENLRPSTDIDGRQSIFDNRIISPLTIESRSTTTAPYQIPYFGNAATYQNYISFAILEASLRLNDGSDSPGATNYNYLVTDGFPYLGFGIATSTIILKNIEGQQKPAFVFNTTVMSLNYINPAALSNDDDYYLSFHIYDSQTQKDIYNTTIPINSRTVYQSSENRRNYGVELIVGDPTKFNPSRTYLFDAYLVYNGSIYQGKDWRGKKISTLTTLPVVNPGFSIYSSSDHLDIGYPPWPNSAGGDNLEISVYNPSILPSSFNISISDIDWAVFSDNDYAKHAYVCLSNVISVTNFNDCLFVFRNGTTAKYPNIDLGVFTPFQIKKYYLHVYCNDTSLLSTRDCGRSPNSMNKYGDIILSATYSNSVATNLENKVNISINHKTFNAECGDGIVTSPEEVCDIALDYGTDVCFAGSQTEPGCRRFDAPSTPGFERSFWVYDDTGEEVVGNMNPSREVRLVATLHLFDGARADEFYFRTYENGVLMPTSISGESRHDYPTDPIENPYHKANISSEAYSVSELRFNAGRNYSFNIFIDRFGGSPYSGKMSRNISFTCVSVPSDGCEALSQTNCNNACSFDSSSLGDYTLSCTDEGGTAVVMNKSKTASCEWNANSCKATVGVEIEVAAISYPAGSFVFTSTSEACEGEYKIINLFGDFVPSGRWTCQDTTSSIRVPCRSVAQLPFFGELSIVISTLAIVLVYLFIARKRHKVY